MQKDKILEKARTSRDKKTLLINYVIGNKKKKKYNLPEETRFTRIHENLVMLSIIVTSEEAGELQIY